MFWKGFNRVTGSLIDAFEYYIKILENNPDFHLILINEINYPNTLNIFENRYSLNDINYKANIIILRRSDLLRMSFEKVLILDYATIEQTKGIIKADKIIVISELYTDNQDHFYDKTIYNVTYYGEMPFVYKDITYKMKILFDRFRTIKESKLGYYINSPGNGDRTFITGLDIDNSLPDYFKQHNHTPNFFELFHCYIYYHAGSYFDPHPRLFLECQFYGKEVQYYNPFNIKDGSYYRYKDSLIEELDGRNLTNNDEIVRLFI